MKELEAGRLLDRLRLLPPKKRRFLEERLAEKGIDVGDLGILPRLGQRNVFPMSHTQERLWYLYQLDPVSTAYQISSFHEFPGEIDLENLTRALEKIVRRHETLRTNFENRDGLLLQRIHQACRLELPLIDLKSLESERREAEARRIRAEQHDQPFDLERDSLLRLALLRLSDEDHVLILTIPHIISDAWSIAVFHRELGLLYEAFTTDPEAPSPLAELPIQYGDFVHWQQVHQQPKVEPVQMAYWRRRLKGVSGISGLPTDRPNPETPSWRGGAVELSLASEFALRLREACRQEAATLYMYLLAAYLIMLAHYSQQDDVCVVTPIAGRNREELEGLIGFFANTLVLRTDLSGNPSFRELLRRVRRVVLGAQDRQDISFARLVAELLPDRSLSHSPFFQLGFSMINTPEYEGSESWNRFDASLDAAIFDLLFQLLERSSGEVTGWLYYRADLFDSTSAARMARHWRRLLECAIELPDQGIRDLPMLAPCERHQVLVEWRALGDEEQGHTPSFARLLVSGMVKHDSETGAGETSRLSPSLDVYLVDKHLRPAPLGSVGEMVACGDELASGYSSRPSRSGQYFVPNPFSGVPGKRLYRSGDQARFLATGALIYLGRLERQVEVNGLLVEPSRIATTLKQNPSVKEAEVLALPDASGRHVLAAYVVLREGGSIPELRTFLRERIPESLTPDALFSLESLPRTANGHLDRRFLPDPLTRSSPREAALDRQRLQDSIQKVEESSRKSFMKRRRQTVRVTAQG